MLILLSYYCFHPDDSYCAALHILTWLVFICTYMNTPNQNPELSSVWYKSQGKQANSVKFLSPLLPNSSKQLWCSILEKWLVSLKTTGYTVILRQRQITPTALAPSFKVIFHLKTLTSAPAQPFITHPT